MSDQAVTVSYLRSKKKYPSVWCPGCSLGTIMGALLRAVDELEIPRDDIVFASGIGCTGRMPVYTDFNTFHGTHGRALAFATGIKMAKPRLKVILAMGDGDSTAIGGNHFIHTCRRNLDLTAIVVNNNIYGMTGGQFSPTTPLNHFASTAPYGSIDPPFDICNLAKGSGATYVARTTSYHVRPMQKIIAEAIDHKGFSVVEVMSHCHTTYGRRNGFKDPVEMMIEEKENAVRLAVYEKRKAADASYKLEPGQFLTGVFVNDKDRPEYSRVYADLCTRLREEK